MKQTNAIKKLESKNFDLIVLNSLNDDGAGFGHNTNKITIINKKHEAITFELKEKQEVAKDIVAGNNQEFRSEIIAMISCEIFFN